MLGCARQSSAFLLMIGALVIGASTASAETDVAPRFVGETRCGGAICHGAGQPAPGHAPAGWAPWKSARTQWLSDADRHSDAFKTLQDPRSNPIAAYMGIPDASRSPKCLVCHAPDAPLAYPVTDRPPRGVTCEHCHGPAEHWLEAHTRTDWPERRASTPGFYDNDDLLQRVRRCATCHLAIDHEIVAAGHPALQFEPVAYAQVMRHWDDSDEVGTDGASLDPTIWALGQIVGLAGTATMLAARAGDSDYQALGKFEHFSGRECYQCHHKLVDDALRQAEGHYRMVDTLLASTGDDLRAALNRHWRALQAAVATGAQSARRAALDLDRWLGPVGAGIRESGVNIAAARSTLERLTAPARPATLKRFRYRKPPTSKLVTIEGIESPWWWTPGAPEQTALAIAALCEPVFAEHCGSGPDGIGDDLRGLVRAIDRFDYRHEDFARRLEAIHRTLFP